MKTLVIVAHPEPRSFNHHLAGIAAAALRAGGDEVAVADLYAERFEPDEHGRHFARRARPERFDVQAEQRAASRGGHVGDAVARHVALLRWADRVLIQFPFWWFGVPAIVKGWIDRVFCYGELYSSRRRFEHGVLRGKRVVLSVTVGAPRAMTTGGREADTELLLWPLHYCFAYVGFDVLRPILLHDIRTVEGYGSPDEARACWRAAEATLREALATLDDRPCVPFNGEDDFDEQGRLKPDAPTLSPFVKAGHR